MSNINLITHKNDDVYQTEINLLKESISNLSKDLHDLGDTFSTKTTNYSLTKLSYYEPYNNSIFYIYGSYNKNNLLISNDGLVGIVTKQNKEYSKCELLTTITNLPVSINNTFGTLTDYKNNLFIITNISNYDQVSLNDPVYTKITSTNEKVYIGYVYKIENNDIDKKIYVKSDVDFNNINYLYVIGK